VGLGRLKMTQSVVDVCAEPGTVDLDELIWLGLEQWLSLGIRSERQLGLSDIYEIPAERMNCRHRKVWSRFRIN
jgi:hypothetical protein